MEQQQYICSLFHSSLSLSPLRKQTLCRQLLLYLAEHLASQYGRDGRVTAILNTTEVFILPSLNPDGYQISRYGWTALVCSAILSREGVCEDRRNVGRNNANNRDLNRDFPKQVSNK